MKPLLSQKVRRGRTLAEWESAAQQSTLDGLRAFAERQEARRIAAQGQPRAEPSNVELLQTVRRRKP